MDGVERILVDRAGIEPAASSLRTMRSPKLSYRPIGLKFNIENILQELE